MESSLTQEQMFGGEVDSGCLELSGSLLHPWTWILGSLISYYCSLFCLRGPPIFQNTIPQVGFIPCNVSNIMEPYTFTVVNGLAGVFYTHINAMEID